MDAVYRKAIELGATDEGPPGPRGTSGFYAGYFRDLDGNKLNVLILGLNLAPGDKLELRASLYD